ncbi:MAG: hypothetical protein M9894_14905 [Planctomycetes bacterium]|nr:hypothetical protein [Planctomycetota bacterium]
MRHALFAALAAAVLAAGAQGQDPRPTLIELRQDDAPVREAGRGEFLKVVGRDLHRCPPGPAGAAPPPCAHDGLVVRVAGRVVLVTSAGPDHVQIHLAEDLPPGRTRVEVTLDRRVVGALDLVLLAERRRAPDENRPGPEVRDRFDLTRFDALTDGAGTRFVVEGRADGVPDGMTVSVGLRFERRAVLAPRLVQVAQGRYRATFGPYDRPLPLGAWTASALFELRKQPAVLLRRWALTPTERDELDRVEFVADLVLGTPEQVAAQRAGLEEHYRALVGETDRQLGAVLAAYASACRALFRAPDRPGYDAQAHLAHVRQVQAARTPEELARVETDLRFATAGGHLKADAYQAWAEDEALPAWLASWRLDGEFREATIFPLEPRAARLAQDLHAVLWATLEAHAQALFQAARLETPACFGTPPGGAALPPLEATDRGRRAFERVRDDLLRRLARP